MIQTTLKIPRTEYPRPQFEQKNWLCLNGEWEFAFDDANIGEKEKWQNAKGTFSQTITVLSKVELTPDVDRNEIRIVSFVDGFRENEEIRLEAEIYFEGKLITNIVQTVRQASETRAVGLNDFAEHGHGRLWSPEH
ncbi:hypothetical protein AWM70_12360 [Paenibacillus yonginensis]|uniref:Beta-galactosidase n=1 Tax=Paenibacillus yonginensis TaxID=1462996 RepID=A0A1B1N1L4_9BACL|nr:hypothetical protein [Paenibacillus yonginensis]ANS75301.1 hypothetical protein AWM70_12360 [Paenibacillus yonginensis]